MVQGLVGAIFWGFRFMPLLPKLGSPATARAINMSLLPKLAGAQATTKPPNTAPRPVKMSLLRSRSGWNQHEANVILRRAGHVLFETNRDGIGPVAVADGGAGLLNKARAAAPRGGESIGDFDAVEVAASGIAHAHRADAAGALAIREHKMACD